MIRVAIFTTLDGAQLDAAAIARYEKEGIAVIGFSELTLDQLAPLAKRFRLRHAMIVETGAAIARSKRGAWKVEPCGVPPDTLLDVIRRIEDRSGASLLVHSQAFDEPFTIESGDADAVECAAAEAGFAIVRGHRFLHLRRASGEDDACARLREELQADLVIGVGVSVADAEVLTRADVAIILPDEDGIADEELIARVPDARIATAPDAWAAAIDEVLRSSLPPLGDGSAEREPVLSRPHGRRLRTSADFSAAAPRLARAH